MLLERDKAPHHIPTKARQVFDVSGAGDTAIALFTLALCLRGIAGRGGGNRQSRERGRRRETGDGHGYTGGVDREL